jgi:hypothetical protein
MMEAAATHEVLGTLRHELPEEEHSVVAATKVKEMQSA